MYVYDDTKLTQIFCNVDDFYQAFSLWQSQHSLSVGFRSSRGPTSNLCPSEVMTILIFYHLSGFKCFKYYYVRLVQKTMKREFPQAPTYERFISQMSQAFLPLFGLVHLICKTTQDRGIYFIDSTKLAVCHNRRISSHKVFKGIAQRGKTSVGWFYGLKLHIVINEMGQLVAFHITAGNVADNNPNLLRKLLKGLKGKCFGDKGYLTSILEELIETGIHLFAKVRKKMKPKPMKMEDKQLLKKRTLVETVIDILKHICNIDHTRHRKPDNALTHLMAGLAAYCFLDHKPSIFKNESPFKILTQLT